MKKITILFVDDEKALQEAVKASLEEAGIYAVTTVSSAIEAIGLLVSTSFDGIICDYQMPDMDALEFLKIIRASGDSSHGDAIKAPFVYESGLVPGVGIPGREVTSEGETEERTRWDRARQRAEAELILKISTEMSLSNGKDRVLIGEIIRSAASILQTERTGVWFFDREKEQFIEAETFTASDRSCTSGTVLRSQNLPGLCDLLRRDIYIDTEYAETDPCISGFFGDHIRENRTTALLAAGIIIEDTIQGLLIFEHAGRSHSWQDDERIFACQLGAQISLALSIQKREQAYTEGRIAHQGLKLANNTLQTIVGIARHDILNQVMVAKGYTDLLLIDRNDPEIGRRLVNIHQSVTVIEDLAKLTGYYSTMGTADPLWQQIDGILKNREITRILSDISLTLDTTGIELYADGMLKNVWFILVDNSVRYGKGVTQISLTAQYKGNDLLLIYEDDGEGILQIEKELIFERGYGNYAGPGLFFAREILAITGLSIWETGEPGKGARFEIFVPDGRWKEGQP